MVKVPEKRFTAQCFTKQVTMQTLKSHNPFTCWHRVFTKKGQMCNNLRSIATNFNNIEILKAALDSTSKTLQFLLAAMQRTQCYHWTDPCLRPREILKLKALCSLRNLAHCSVRTLQNWHPMWQETSEAALQTWQAGWAARHFIQQASGTSVFKLSPSLEIVIPD